MPGERMEIDRTLIDRPTITLGSELDAETQRALARTADELAADLGIGAYDERAHAAVTRAVSRAFTRGAVAASRSVVGQPIALGVPVRADINDIEEEQ